MRVCDETTQRHIPLRAGSSVEFYIQPMLSYIGDIDIMHHPGSELAVPDGYPLPTDLPAEFHNLVEVYDIVGSDEYPGYVYLALSSLSTEDTGAGKYRRLYQSRSYMTQVHGPARLVHYRSYMGHYGTAPFPANASRIDVVPCVRCLSWPSQAADWPTRHRNYGWPDSATVDRVVGNGCDVVCAVHHLCREDEWMGEHQFRLSFSRAEIVLLNSWMPVQQIVYHMLRFFAKNERLRDTTDSAGLSNYHFKTLMMWTYELKPQSWWIDDMNVVRMCVNILHILANWLKNKTCQHYFINDSNLINSKVHWEIGLNLIASRLVSITESWLSTWFVNNYLRRCAQHCPERVSRLFDDIGTQAKLQNAVSAVVDWRLNSTLHDLWCVCLWAQYYLPFTLSKYPYTVRSYSYLITELAKVDSCLCNYFTAVTFLFTTNELARRSFYDELLDILVTILGQFNGKRRYCHQLSSEYCR